MEGSVGRSSMSEFSLTAGGQMGLLDYVGGVGFDRAGAAAAESSNAFVAGVSSISLVPIDRLD